MSKQIYKYYLNLGSARANPEKIFRKIRNKTILEFYENPVILCSYSLWENLIDHPNISGSINYFRLHFVNNIEFLKKYTAKYDLSKYDDYLFFNGVLLLLDPKRVEHFGECVTEKTIFKIYADKE